MSGVRQRKSTGGSSSSAVGAATGTGPLRFFTEDAPGLKIGPTTVLILSLLFVGFVVVLHTYGKLRK